MSMTNELCLAFVNTVRWHASAEPEETLHGYLGLLKWAHERGIVEESDAELAQLAQQEPAQAAAVFARALALRETTYRLLVAHMHGEAGDPADLVDFNQELARTLGHARVVPVEGGYSWDWKHDQVELDAVLWPIVRTAAELLTTPALLERIGQCADDRGCGWLFLDLSKNRSRRWCDINDCGNRAKQRRHYLRTRLANER
jgi:predicted RNA-binding Zn ribbon-like protein